MKTLDAIPLASIIAVIGAVVGGVIAIVNPDTLSFQDYCVAVGVLAGGSGVLGYARAQSGKGVK